MLPSWPVHLVSSVLCFWAVGLVPRSAHAQPPLIVTLGILSRERVDEDLSVALYNALPGGQRRDPTLTLEERRCREPECLAELGDRLGVGLLVAGTLHAGPIRENRRAYTLDLLVFDVQSRRPTNRSLARHSKTELASDLSEELPRLLDAHAEPRAFPRPESISLLASADDPGQPGESQRWPRWRITFVGGLSALAVLSLTAGIVAHALHGRTAPGICDDAPTLKIPHNTDCVFQTVPLLIPGYSVGLGSALGLALNLALP